MIKCSELFKSNKINSYYEFLFALSLAEECGRVGECLDMSMMKIRDKNMLASSEIDYMHYLRSKGFIYDGSNKTDDSVCSYNGVYAFNTGILNDEDVKVFLNCEDSYYWDTEYAYSEYGKYTREILKRDVVGNTVMHLAAYMCLSFYLGTKEKKPIRFYFKNLEVKSPNMYLDLYACCRVIPMLKEVCEIVFDENYTDNTVDLNFLIHYVSAQHANGIKKWSLQDKMRIFKRYGFKKGSIAILFERERVSRNNPIGKIIWASIIRIDDFTEDLSASKSAGWLVTKFSVNKTIEENEDDYLGISDEYREIYSDMLEEKLPSDKMFLSFENVGIGEYFDDESFLILPLEKGEKVVKKVSVEGSLVSIELDEVEAIYWILKEYKVDFDENLYKSFYNDGEMMLYDKFDCTPVRRCKNSRC